MTHAHVEAHVAERVRHAHARAAHARLVSEARRSASARRWHRVADLARARAVRAAGE